MSATLSTIFAIVGLIGSVATAVATIFLWRVTSTLAVETKRMAESAAQPHVVITLGPNRWSWRHFDISIENTGNAVAYEVQVSVSPPLKNGKPRKNDSKIPFERVSVLKPGQSLTSYLAEHSDLKEENYTVSISWGKKAGSIDRQSNTYVLSMADHEGISRLGDDPMVDIARYLKGLDGNISSVFKGDRSINVAVHTAKDREKERQETLAFLEADEARRAHKPEESA